MSLLSLFVENSVPGTLLVHSILQSEKRECKALFTNIGESVFAALVASYRKALLFPCLMLHFQINVLQINKIGSITSQFQSLSVGGTERSNSLFK